MKSNIKNLSLAILLATLSPNINPATCITIKQTDYCDEVCKAMDPTAEYLDKFKNVNAFEKAVSELTPEQRKEFEEEKRVQKSHKQDWWHVEDYRDFETESVGDKSAFYK